MPPRNAEATKERILSAAVTEFAEYGFAGGRVERIARQAGTNVRMIYAYFGGKDSLFDAALADAVRAMAAAVPPTPDDMPGWAGRLFDYHARSPVAMRISLWAQLERPLSASEPVDSYLAKTARVSDSAGTSMAAVDLLTLIYAMAQAWCLTPLGLLSADGSDPQTAARISAHREALMTAVRSMV